MANLEFLPLYVLGHDNWGYSIPHLGPNGMSYETFPHRGHTHFFMPGFNHGGTSRRAYTGTQVFNFSLADTWSPRTNDPNQTQNISFDGTPEWYFLVKEYWRRVYIQPWDSGGGRGLKYDASSAAHTQGPWREARGAFFYWNDMARTLPIEYFTNEERTLRENHLGLPASGVWDTSTEKYDLLGEFPIPAGFWAEDPGESNARCQAWPDNLYAGPTIEYQRVDQLAWERSPGWEGRPDGDGFELELELPLKGADGTVLSPFGSSESAVMPFGAYCNGFSDKFPEKIPKYPSSNTAPDGRVGARYLIPEELLGQPVTWRVPESVSNRMDGIWVEQFLGGVAKAAAKVKYFDNFGGRHIKWVTESNFRVSDKFVGKDGV